LDGKTKAARFEKKTRNAYLVKVFSISKKQGKMQIWRDKKGFGRAILQITDNLSRPGRWYLF
jgi:hypothetical protein